MWSSEALVYRRDAVQCGSASSLNIEEGCRCEALRRRSSEVTPCSVVVHPHRTYRKAADSSEMLVTSYKTSEPHKPVATNLEFDLWRHNNVTDYRSRDQGSIVGRDTRFYLTTPSLQILGSTNGYRKGGKMKLSVDISLEDLQVFLHN